MISVPLLENIFVFKCEYKPQSYSKILQPHVETFFLATKSCYVIQVGLELLSSIDSPASDS